MAAFRGGRGKIDDLCQRESARNAKVKSLLSNMLLGVGGEAGEDLDSATRGSDSLDGGDDQDSMVSSAAKSIPVAARGQAKPSKLGDGDDDWQVLAEIEPTGDNDLLSRNELLEAHSTASDKSNRTEQLIIVEQAEDSQQHSSVVVDGGDEDLQSVQSRSSVDSWNYATAVETTVFPFMCAVCLPSRLMRSEVGESVLLAVRLQFYCYLGQCWGDPRHYLRISNFSRTWSVEVHWVDEDCSLVPRTEIKAGDTHYELCSVDHVWALVASRVSRINSRYRIGGGTDADADDKYCASASMSASPATLFFRVPRASLVDGRYMSIFWSPLSSMTVAQRTHDGKQRSSEGNAQQPPSPVVHLQIFDSPTSDSSVGVQELPSGIRLPNWRRMAKDGTKSLL